MKKDYIEAGKIVNTHGIQGEVKIVPWADDAKFLTRFKRFFMEGHEYTVSSSRCHGDNLIVKFDDVKSMDEAIRLRDKVIYISRSDANLPDGNYFIADLIGADVLNEDGNKVGILTDVLEYPASKIYVIKKPDGTETLVPAVKEFIKSIDSENGTITIHFIEGM